jgi:hypothetical protein
MTIPWETVIDKRGFARAADARMCGPDPNA